MKKLIIFCVFTCILLENCTPMKLQKPKILKKDIPENCGFLYDDLMQNWKKHRRYDCYQDYMGATTFLNKYRTCLEGLKRKDIIGLLGSPNKSLTPSVATDSPTSSNVDKNGYSYYYFMYVFDKDCSKVKYGHFTTIDFTFIDEKVFNIDVTLHTWVE